MLEPKAAISLSRLLARCIAAAAILGGSVFWARRVGWLQAETYWHGHRRILDWFDTQSDYAAASAVVARFNNSLHETQGWLWLTKFPKEIVALAFLLIAATQFRRTRLPREFVISYSVLFGLAGISTIPALLAGRWLELIYGLRTFVAWALGATAAPLASAAMKRSLARACIALLVVQALLVLIEMRHGLLIYSMNYFGTDLVRAVGSFNLPISLGTYVVVAWCVAWCWGELNRSAFAVVTVVTVALLVASASAAAWIAFVAAAIAAMLRTMNLHGRVTTLVVTMPLMIAIWVGLPSITGRWNIHDSLWGRIYPVQTYAARHLSITEIAFGSGFGRGTNANNTATPPSSPPLGVGDVQVGDSLPAVLFWQVGMVGLLSAYFLIFMAIRSDSQSRPIGVAILVSSIAVNVTELFPVNIVLGFWLAHVARVEEPGEAHT